MLQNDIIPYLNECLLFMYENIEEMPEVIPQHIIQHLENLGMGDISLIESKSLLDTLEHHKCVSVLDGRYSLTRSGIMLIISGGFKF